MSHALRTLREAEVDGWKAIAPFGLLPNGRKRFCGAWTLRGNGLDRPKPKHNSKSSGSRPTAKSRKFVRLLCRCWSCSLCGPRKAIKYRAQILREVGRSNLTRMLTLTLDVRKIAAGTDLQTFLEHFEARKSSETACRCSTCTRVQVNSIAHIRQSWSKLRVYLHRRYRKAPKYIAILEFQKVTGLAHLHIVIDRYIEQTWAKQVWQAVGGGQHVDIRHVDAHRAAAYLSKYLSKEMLLSAPSGMRRVSTSRSIRLNKKKPSEFRWEVFKSSIDACYVMYQESAEDIIRKDGELESFSLLE